MVWNMSKVSPGTRQHLWSGLSTGHVQLQQRSERVLQSSLQQHQSPVMLDSVCCSKKGFIGRAMAMAKSATSEKIARCMISESAYAVCFFS